MTLIICPECGKEISNKSVSCIHCGYPLNKTKILPDCVNEDELRSYIEIGEVQSGIYLQKTIGCNQYEARNILKKYMLENNLRFNIKSPPPRTSIGLICPHCHSSSVSTGARGANGFFGFIGASKTVNRCGKCGYTWKP